jgi:hypothetical protein
MEWDKGSCGPAPDTRGLKTDHGARLASRRRHIVRARPAKGARKPPKPNPSTRPLEVLPLRRRCHLSHLGGTFEERLASPPAAGSCKAMGCDCQEFVEDIKRRRRKRRS